MTPSDSSRRLADSNIVIIEPAKGQWVAGWITSTQTSSGDLMYGPFDTIEQAVSWAHNMTSAVVLPVYVPTTNQG
jgi:hypothetical protein